MHRSPRESYTGTRIDRRDRTTISRPRTYVPTRANPGGCIRGARGGRDRDGDGRAGRAGLRRHHGRAGGRGAGGAAARVPAVGPLLGRGHARPGRRRAAHAARPTSAATRRARGRSAVPPTGRPSWSPTPRPSSRRRWRRPGGRARTSSGTTGAPLVAWALAGSPARAASDTVTGISVPPPGAMSAALRRPRQLLASWYMAAFAVPGLAERAFAVPAGRRGRPGLVRMLVRSGQTRERAERDAARLADPAALTAALDLVPGASADPAASAIPHGDRARPLRLERPRHRPDPRRRRAGRSGTSPGRSATPSCAGSATGSPTRRPARSRSCSSSTSRAR